MMEMVLKRTSEKRHKIQSEASRAWTAWLRFNWPNAKAAWADFSRYGLEVTERTVARWYYDGDLPATKHWFGLIAAGWMEGVDAILEPTRTIGSIEQERARLRAERERIDNEYARLEERARRLSQRPMVARSASPPGAPLDHN